MAKKPDARTQIRQMYERTIAAAAVPPEVRIKTRNEKLAQLRERSGLSMDELAKEMGFKGQSSIQRYLSPDYDRGFRPELAARFKAALLGRGKPPIRSLDLGFLENWLETPDGQTLDMVKMLAANIEAGGTSAELREHLKSLGVPEASRSSIGGTLNIARRSILMDDDHRLVGLPLREGDVILKIPKKMSTDSAATLRDWLDHMISLSTTDPKD